MKLFGEYLIDKGIISKGDLVKALIIQLESTPSVTEAVYKNGLRNTDEFFEIFQIQFKKKTGFIEAARELGLWDDKVQSSVEKYIASTRIPLGEILVQTGLAEIETISHALDDFLAGVEVVPVATQEIIPSDESKDNDFLSELASIENEVLNNPEPSNPHSAYFEYFTLDLFLELTSLLSFEQAGTFSSERINEIINIFRTLKGSARFANLYKSEKLISSIETKFQAVLKVGVEKMTPALMIKLENHSKRYLDVLWSICEELQNNLNEDESIRTRNLETTYKQLSGEEL